MNQKNNNNKGEAVRISGTQMTFIFVILMAITTISSVVIPRVLTYGQLENKVINNQKTLNEAEKEIKDIRKDVSENNQDVGERLSAVETSIENLNKSIDRLIEKME